MVALNQDMNTIEANNSSGIENRLMPAGRYQAIIAKTERKETKGGTGAQAVFEYTISMGEFKGQKLWSRHTIQNSNPKAVNIGMSQIRAVMDACQTIGNDTSILHGKSLTLNVRQKPHHEDKDKTVNDIESWHPMDGAQPQAPTQSQDQAGEIDDSWGAPA